MSRYQEHWIRRALDQAEAAIEAGDQRRLCSALGTLPSELFMLLYFDRPPEWPKLAQWLPQMPPNADQQAWTGLSGFECMHHASVFVDDLFAQLGRREVDLNVLDYGCGWGRMLRLLYNRVPISNVYGADPWDRSLERMRNHGVHGNLVLVDSIPSTLPLPEAHFDLIYSFSVFTHIGPKSQSAILRALRSIIKPDGLLAITVRQADFWPKTDWPNTAAEREKLFDLHMNQGFAHLAHGAGDGLTEFGNTSVSIDYIRDNWRDWRIEKVHWRVADPYQTIVFLRPART